MDFLGKPAGGEAVLIVNNEIRTLGNREILMQDLRIPVS